MADGNLEGMHRHPVPGLRTAHGDRRTAYPASRIVCPFGGDPGVFPGPAAQTGPRPRRRASLIAGTDRAGGWATCRGENLASRAGSRDRSRVRAWNPPEPADEGLRSRGRAPHAAEVRPCFVDLTEDGRCHQTEELPWRAAHADAELGRFEPHLSAGDSEHVAPRARNRRRPLRRAL